LGYVIKARATPQPFGAAARHFVFFLVSGGRLSGHEVFAGTTTVQALLIKRLY
jgi:hypothetical protein